MGVFTPPVNGVSSVALDPRFCMFGDRPGEMEGAIKESWPIP